ncbi:hypothetical protein B7463_g10350, partial [Scytalidium lignicola]
MEWIARKSHATKPRTSCCGANDGGRSGTFMTTLHVALYLRLPPPPAITARQKNDPRGHHHRLSTQPLPCLPTHELPIVEFTDGREFEKRPSRTGIVEFHWVAAVAAVIESWGVTGEAWGVMEGTGVASQMLAGWNRGNPDWTCPSFLGRFYMVLPVP